MPIFLVVHVILGVAECLLVLPIAYLFILAVCAAASSRQSARITPASSSGPPDVQPEPPDCHFAILVPAHDEELVIGDLLHSLELLDYSRDAFEVFVIADNCTDTTATVARGYAGVRVLERHDEWRHGKGYAMRWCLDQLARQGGHYDGYVMLDADTVVTSNLLRVFACALRHGAAAIQARYTVANPSDGPSAALRWLALTLANHIRPLGRWSLGGSAGLTGNGMCFSQNLLSLHPWQAFGRAEDYEYYLTLVRAGIRVWYAPEAVVFALMPATFAHMRSQELRWETWSMEQPKWQIALELLRGGIQRRDVVRLEALAELLTPPLSLLLSGALLLGVGCLVFDAPWEGAGDAVLLAALLGSVGSAFVLARPPRAIYPALLYVPSFVAWKIWIRLVHRKPYERSGEWGRTPRAVRAQ